MIWLSDKAIEWGNKWGFTPKFTKHSKGYDLVKCPNHPFRNGSGFIPVHRIVAESEKGEVINPSLFDVHHKDEKINNNSPENLLVLTKKEHRRLHAGWKLVNNEWFKTCNGCKRFLKVADNFFKRTGHNEYVSKCKICVNVKSKSSMRKLK